MAVLLPHCQVLLPHCNVLLPVGDELPMKASSNALGKALPSSPMQKPYDNVPQSGGSFRQSGRGVVINDINARAKQRALPNSVVPPPRLTPKLVRSKGFVSF